MTEDAHKHDTELPDDDQVVVNRNTLEIVVELARARRDEDARRMRKGDDPRDLGYDSFTLEEADDAISLLEQAVDE